MVEEKKTFVIGFAVLIDLEGNVYLETNPEAFSMGVERPATLREVRRYTSELLMDLVKLASANQKASAETE
jgi:hypothetical protein